MFDLSFLVCGVLLCVKCGWIHWHGESSTFFFSAHFGQFLHATVTYGNWKTGDVRAQVLLRTQHNCLTREYLSTLTILQMASMYLQGTPALGWCSDRAVGGVPNTASPVSSTLSSAGSAFTTAKAVAMPVLTSSSI